MAASSVHRWQKWKQAEIRDREGRAAERVPPSGRGSNPPVSAGNCLRRQFDDCAVVSTGNVRSSQFNQIGQSSPILLHALQRRPPPEQWAGVACQGRTGTSSGQPKTPIPLRAHESQFPPGPPPPSPVHLPHLPGRQGTKKPPPQTDSLPALSRPFSRSALVPSWMICPAVSYDPTRNATITSSPTTE